MRKSLLVLGMAGILVLGMSFQVKAQEETAAIRGEELIFMEIPIVVTAARREQPITEAPATVFVITAEDIKQSGATNIPDILRTVPGVDVMAITVRDQQVSIRGFNWPLSNKLLVLIDGRSVYWEGRGCVFWNLFTVGLEEIERIEIVKGPGSSLYGANAYCGVINIITKSPAQIKGTELNLVGGDYNTFLGSMLHSGVSEKIGYKVSAEWDRTNEWRDKDESAGEISRANAMVEYKINEENKLSFSGGRAHTRDKKVFATETLGTMEITGNFDYLQLGYDYSNIKFQTFLKKEDIDAKWLRTGEKQPWSTATYDLELQYSLGIGTKHLLILGGSYRYNTVEKNSLIPEEHRQNLQALFLEDEIRIMDKFKLTLGGRYDWHPLSGEHFSPRGNISYSPVKDHIIRLAAGKAFRNPTFVDSYLYAERQLTMTLPPPLPNVPFTYILQGNENLKSEEITSYEAGYRSIWLKKVICNLNLFYNEYTSFFSNRKDFIYYTNAELSNLGLPPGLLIPKTVITTYINEGSAWGIGGEIDLNIFINRWLSGIANYSYQQITNREDNIFATPLINEKDRVRQEDPKNKVNAGMRMKFENGVSANLLVHWEDKTKRLVTDLQENTHEGNVDDYTIVNIRVGYAFLKDNAEVSLSVFNLFNDKHYEYSPGVNLPDISSDEIGRRITANVSYKF